MKKILLFLTIICVIYALPVLADDAGYGGIGDSMKDTNGVENAFNGQKPITDEEFQKTLDKLKAKQNKGKKLFKGKNVNEENSGTYLDETTAKVTVLSVPLDLVNGDGAEIPVGHYKIVGVKEKNDVYLDFYQSAMRIARVPAIETNNDFKENNINFVKLMPYNSQRVEIIYGSIDFNAYTFIRIRDEISDGN